MTESLNLRLAEADAEIERLRAGEEPHDVDPFHPFHGTVCAAPGRWIYRWNTATPERRIEVAEWIERNRNIADTCVFQSHVERLREAEQHIKELRNGAVHKRLAGKLDEIALIAYRPDRGGISTVDELAAAIVAIIEGRG